MNRRIAIAASLGRYVRTLLRSDLPRLLLSDPGTHLAILSPGAGEPEFQEEFSQNGRVQIHPLEDVQMGRALWQRALWKASLLSQRSRWAYPVAMDFSHWCHRILSPRYYAWLFQEFQPQIVLVGSCGFSTHRDVPLIREARAARVPTLYVVHSWDNLNGVKGTMLERPDWLAVWNDSMKKEAIERYHYPPTRVEAIGALQFDFYAAPQPLRERSDFLSALGLDPARWVLTLATGMPDLDSAYVVESLTKAKQQGLIPRDLQLVCRVHPLDPYPYEERFSQQGVFIDRFHHRTERLGWDPTLEESLHVANLMRHSAAVVNIASTITLEAALTDTPVVHVAYHPVHPELFSLRILQEHWKRHFRLVEASQATWVARNEESLMEGIRHALEQPQERAPQRRRLVESVCGLVDGKASARLTQMIQRVILEGR